MAVPSDASGTENAAAPRKKDAETRKTHRRDAYFGDRTAHSRNANNQEAKDEIAKTQNRSMQKRSRAGLLETDNGSTHTVARQFAPSLFSSFWLPFPFFLIFGSISSLTFETREVPERLFVLLVSVGDVHHFFLRTPCGSRFRPAAVGCRRLSERAPPSLQAFIFPANPLAKPRKKEKKRKAQTRASARAKPFVARDVFLRRRRIFIFRSPLHSSHKPHRLRGPVAHA